MTTRVAPAGPAHAPLIAALMVRCLPEAWSASAVGRTLAAPGAFGCIALADTAPVGYAIAQRAGADCELHSIGVIAEARRRGAGTALHRAVVAAAHGAERIILEVGADDAAALAFYATLGYRRYGRRPGYYRRRTGAGADALLLERWLDSTPGATTGCK